MGLHQEYLALLISCGYIFAKGQKERERELGFANKERNAGILDRWSSVVSHISQLNS